jgi:tetratricopeptide (TPR) repeat protein
MCLLAVTYAGAALGYDNRSADPTERTQALWKQGAGLHLEGRYEPAIESYRRALRMHPTARTHTYLAWSLSSLGRYDEAVSHCHAAIALDPSYPNAYNDLGSYLVALGRPGEAIQWLRHAAQTPGYCCPHFAYYHLGRALLMQARVEEAQAAFETALALRPRYRPARALLETIHGKGLKGL